MPHIMMQKPCSYAMHSLLGRHVQSAGPSSSGCYLQGDGQRQGRTQPGGDADWGFRPAENQILQQAPWARLGRNQCQARDRWKNQSE